jgi:phospholipid/cholesterol/gamma-HCH transport system substrate-binding protein
MAKQGENNIKLGAFVLAGLLVLIFSFYMIGKNHNLFGSGYELKARFANLNGLTEGSNVLFSGLQAGTVKSIAIINDTTIEVTMMIDNNIKNYIHKNAIAAVGTEGLMGNKIVNITPAKGASPNVATGDLLASKEIVNMDEMLQTLSKTNKNIANITESLKVAALRIKSSAILDVLNDKQLGNGLKSSLKNISKAASNANEMIHGLNEIVKHIKQGKGGAGVLLSDTAFAGNLKDAMAKIRSASENANQMTIQLNTMVKEIKQDITSGKGPVNTVMRDSIMAKNLSLTMENLRKGTDGFNQNMEALKHNFLLRGYFKNLEKQKKKEQEAAKKKSGGN